MEMPINRISISHGSAEASDRYIASLFRRESKPVAYTTPQVVNIIERLALNSIDSCVISHERGRKRQEIAVAMHRTLFVRSTHRILSVRSTHKTLFIRSTHRILSVRTTHRTLVCTTPRLALRSRVRGFLVVTVS